MPLFLIASPIGNLSDISQRALETLRSCDLLAAEDTRNTKKLLTHFGISVPMIAYYEDVEAKRLPELIRRLEVGQQIGLISDAGTPCVSDPGARLVRACIDHGLVVSTIPGPNAPITALVLSGLPTEQFRFCGFMPRKPNAKRQFALSLRAETETTIVFEAPTRLLDTLLVLEAVLGSRQLAVARELTKLHEEVLRGTAREVHDELASRDRVRGEITVVIAPAESTTVGDSEILRYIEVVQAQNLDPKTVRALVSKLLAVPKKRVFALMESRN